MDRIFITGGTGFLGRAILTFWPELATDSASFTVYSRDPMKHQRIRNLYGAAGVRTIMGDVLDGDRLAAAMAGHDVVIHAAAQKHIPFAEDQPGECVRVNVQGSQAVIRAAQLAGVRKVVAISTDKAANPVNVYGATKLLMERLFLEAHQQAALSGTAFSVVRYGNVVGSTGSVIPLFREQIRAGKLTITDPMMTRFHLSPKDAAKVIRTGLETPGAVYIPKLGGMRMAVLADTVAPGVPVEIIGARPGEKLDETLISDREADTCWHNARGYWLGARPLETVEYGAEAPNSHLAPRITPEKLLAMIAEADLVR